MTKKSIAIPQFISSNIMPLITFAVILSLMLVALVGLNTWRMYGNFNEVVTTEFELQNLTGKIFYFDEVLTMSARMAAATGDLDWEERYLQFEPQLDRVLAKAIDLAPETAEDNAAETNAANIQLVEMENRAFELVRQGRPEEALQLLLSKKYQFEKQVYAKGINQTVAALETRIKYNINSYRENLFTSSLFSLLNFPILLFAWMTVLGLLNWYIQQRKQAEMSLQAAKIQLEKANETLAQRVKERTAQLEEAKDRAEAANRSKDRFLANISHELRTPLNSILGYAQLMIRRDRNLSATQIKNLKTIQKGGTHLLTLINEILDYTKTEVGKIELHPTTVRLTKFVRETVDIVKNSAAEKGLEINYQAKFNSSLAIEADETRLQQVILNLLGNAIKFTDKGKIDLRVSTIEIIESNSTQKLRFEVIDTGVGISQEKLSTIFAPFEQLGDVKSKAAGTGLGLAISSQLVQLMGGTLQVKSQVDRGSTFWFEAVFPVLDSTVTKLEIEPQNGSKKIIAYQGRKRKILVVDDKKENRSLLIDLLEPLGFELIVAENGEQMLDVAQNKKPDLVLLDLFMPVKTGFTSAKEFRQTPEFKDIPILILSASSITETTRQYLECDAYLSKPIDQQKLFALLKQYLNLQWVYRERKSL